MAVPAAVRTVHISQGGEWDAIIADCSRPPKMDLLSQWLANSVMLSRATTLEGLLLLRLPPRSFFSLGAPAHIVEELERLHNVEKASQERLAAYVRSLPSRVSIPSVQQRHCPHHPTSEHQKVREDDCRACRIKGS